MAAAGKKRKVEDSGREAIPNAFPPTDPIPVIWGSFAARDEGGASQASG